MHAPDQIFGVGLIDPNLLDRSLLAKADVVTVRWSKQFCMSIGVETWLHDEAAFRVFYSRADDDDHCHICGFSVPENVVLASHRDFAPFVLTLSTTNHGVQYYLASTGIFTVGDWNFIMKKFEATGEPWVLPQPLSAKVDDDGAIWLSVGAVDNYEYASDACSGAMASEAVCKLKKSLEPLKLKSTWS